MDLSFVLLTWNSASYLEKCLASITNAMRGTALAYEVLVLDNGSTDATPQILKELASRDPSHLRAFFEPVNTGTTRSRNRLFSEAIGRFICVMDSDVELSPGVMDTLLPFLERDSGLGVVVPRIHYPSGAWQKSFDHFPTAVGKLNRFFRLRAIEKSEAASVRPEDPPFLIDYAISAFWLMRRELLERVGTLDERIFYAPEDADFCLRVWKAGLRILYVPAVSVVHHTQEISRGFKLNRAKLSHIKGLAYYFAKHGYLLRKPHFRA